MIEVNEFDLNAAWIRHTQSDFKAFMEGFATRMEGAFPGNVQVIRKRDGLFSSTRHVSSIAIDAGQYTYRLEIDSARLTATRAQTIRGVTLKSDTLPVPEWLASLNRDIQALADHAGSARSVLHDFLLS